MITRKKNLFKVNDQIVAEESVEMTIDMVEKMKWIIAEECQCPYDDIEVEYKTISTNSTDLSEEIDVGVEGLHYWNSVYPDPIQGLHCDLVIGSDEYLDAISNGTIEQHINFYVNGK